MKVISFCIYGSHEKYCRGLLENLYIMKETDYNAYIYVGDGVPINYIQQYMNFTFTTLIYTNRIGADNMINRYFAIDEPDVDMMFVRDADSRLHARDLWCIRDFIASGFALHTIRDHPGHAAYIMGGLWGIQKPALSLNNLSMRGLYKQYNPNNKVINQIQHDQHFLRDVLYPIFKHMLFVHVYNPRMQMDVAETVRQIPFRVENHDFCGLVITYDPDERKSYVWDDTWINDADLCNSA